MLRKVVRFAYSQGIVRSRAIERVCQEPVTCMAVCGMAAPHFTPIAHFVSTLRDDLAPVCASVLAVCDGQGLIGRERLAIDGVKRPSNASKHRSGTRVEFTQRAEKLAAAAQAMLDRHRATDTLALEPEVAAKTTARVARHHPGCAALAGVVGHASDGSPRADGARAIARTLSARTWQRTRASFRGIRGSPRSMRNIRSWSTRTRRVPGPNRHGAESVAGHVGRHNAGRAAVYPA